MGSGYLRNPWHGNFPLSTTPGPWLPQLSVSISKLQSYLTTFFTTSASPFQPHHPVCRPLSREGTIRYAFFILDSRR